MDLTQPICPICHQTIQPGWYFCANCGRALQAKPPSTTWWSQLGIYALSLALPPLGLWPAFKYIRSHDNTARTVGWIAVGLTVVSVIASIYLFQQLMQQLTATLNGAS